MTTWAAAESKAKEQFGVISREQLEVLKLKRGAVSAMLQRGRIESVHRGVYRFTLVSPSLRQRIIAALLALPPKSALSHFSALREWDLRGVDLPGSELHFSVPDRRVYELGSDIIVHRPRHAFSVFQRNGVPVTGLAWSLIDVAHLISADQLETWLDAAQKRHPRLPSWLRKDLEKTSSRFDAGVTRLKKLLASRSGAPAESPLETRTFQYLRAHGLPLPVKQHSISDSAGFICFADFAWPDFLVCAQFDSTTWHALGPRFHLDAAQRSRLAAAGWLCLTVTSKMLESETWREELPRILERHQPQQSLFVTTFPHGDRRRDQRR
jgi:hypothetical protein